MKCHVIILLILLYTTGTTYTFYEIEKQKETIKEKTKTKKTNQKRKTRKRKQKEKEKIEETNCCRDSPPQARWQTLEKKRGGKKEKITKTTLLVNRVRAHLNEPFS